ncbi:MAG: sugar porter family MFS transporter [Bacteroidota bacterium]
MKSKIFLYSFITALGGLLFGFDTAVINGALPFFSAYFKLDNGMQGFAVGSALLGCVVGAITIGRPGDKYGRKYMLIWMAALMFISAIGSGAANDITTFIIFRIIGGLGVGGASVLSPMYITEIAPPAYRGRFTITFQLAIVLGILLAFFSDYLLIDTGVNNWRWMFIAEGLPAVAFFVLLFFVSKSPRWLVKSNNIEEAREVLRNVNPEAETEKLLEEIKDSIDTDVVEHFKYLFKKPYLRLVVIGIFVGMFNQFTGINVIMYYSSNIFITAGFSADSALAQSVLVGLTNLIFTVLAMILIDKIGRKFMLLFGAVGMSIFLAVFSYFYLNQIEGYVLLIMLLGFVAFFAFSQGAVIWVLLAEMFPNNIRARGSSIGSFSLWTFNTITAFLFPVVAATFEGSNGIGYAFIFYAVMTIISFFFFKVFLIETKGKSLEELEKHMLKQ